MPGLTDDYFAGSLTFLCEQNDQGALGLVINKPLDLTLGELVSQMGFTPSFSSPSDALIFQGGPVHKERGFVLHTGSPNWKASLPINERLSLTTSVDILEALAAGEGPEDFLIALGCAGWEAGQLEQELLDNTWLTCPATEEILFRTPIEERIDAAAASLGVNLNLMTGQAGHA